jgi:hypothetical protein
LHQLQRLQIFWLLQAVAAELSSMQAAAEQVVSSIFQVNL